MIFFLIVKLTVNFLEKPGVLIGIANNERFWG